MAHEFIAKNGLIVYGDITYTGLLDAGTYAFPAATGTVGQVLTLQSGATSLDWETPSAVASYFDRSSAGDITPSVDGDNLDMLTGGITVQNLAVSMVDTTDQILITQTSTAGVQGQALIHINDDRTGVTANEIAEATIVIDAEGTYAVEITDGVVHIGSGSGLTIEANLWLYDNKPFYIGTGADVQLMWDTNGTGDDVFKWYWGQTVNPVILFTTLDINDTAEHDGYESPTFVMVNAGASVPPTYDYAGVVIGERTQNDIESTHYFDFYAMVGNTWGESLGAQIPATFRMGNTGTATTGHAIDTGSLLLENDLEVNGTAYFDGSVDWASGNVVYVPLAGDIETAIAAATAGDTIILAAGTYTVTDDIDIAQSINVVGQGVGATLVQCGTGSKNIFHISVGDVRIADLTISTTGDASIGIKATGGTTPLSGIVIDRVKFVGTAGDGITSFRFENAGGTVKDCIVVNDGTGASDGIYVIQTVATSTFTVDIYNTYSKGTRYGAIATGSAYSVSNWYGCTLKGATNDIGRFSSAVATLYDTTLVNNTTSGTITYGGTVVGKNASFSPDSDNVGGVIASRAKMGFPTGGYSDYAFWGHVDRFGDTTSYCMAQGPTGDTTIGASAATGIYLSIDGANKLKVDGPTGAISFTNNSDTLTFTGEGSNWYQKWSDGYLFLQTDEGTNTSSVVCIQGKGTGTGDLILIDGVLGDGTYTQLTQNDSVGLIQFGANVTEFVINETGGDVDFRVESDTLDAFKVDGGTGAITFGNTYTFPVATGTIGQVLTLQSGAATLDWETPAVATSYWDRNGIILSPTTTGDTVYSVFFDSGTAAIAGKVEIHNGGSLIIHEAGDDTGGQTLSVVNGTQQLATNGHLQVPDGYQFMMGASNDWGLKYDEANYDQFIMQTIKTSAIAITDPMAMILVDANTAAGTNLTANQLVFGVAKGLATNNVKLFTVDAEGDVVIPGTLDVTGVVTINSAFAFPTATGTVGQVLTLQSGATALDWETPSSGASYWDRTGTVLSPLTGGDTVEAVAFNIPTKRIVVDTFTSAGINAAIDALGSDGGEVYLPEGTYVCTDTDITIDYDNTTLTGAGYGTILDWSAGQNTTLAGIVTNAKSHTTIQNIHFLGNRGEAVYDAFIGIAGDDADYLIVRGCYFESGAARGIQCGGEYVQIPDNVFYDMAFDCISLGGQNGQIESNQFLSCNDAIICDANTTHIIISNNIIESMTGYGIDVRGQYAHVIGNTIIGVAETPISSSSINAVISNNIIYGIQNTYAGIKFTGSYSSITGNYIKGGGTGDKGIWLDNCDYSIITGNTTQGCQTAGIQEDADCQNNLISGNNAQDTIPYIINGTAPKSLVTTGAIVFISEYDNGNIGDSGVSTTIDWNNGNKQKATLTDDETLTFTAPTTGVANFTLKAVNFGAFTPTWPGTVFWSGGTEPTWTASGTDIISFYWDGTSYYGAATLDFS